MHWRFEPIFSLKVLHQNVVDQPPVDPANYIYEFDVVPARESLNRFRQLGWTTKSVDGGLLIFAEKTVREDGSDFIRRSPLPDEVFTFYLQLNRPGVLSTTQPFAKTDNGQVIPNDQLPYFSGQGRIVYLQSLEASIITDNNNETIHRLTADEFIDTAELASRGVTPFLFRTEDAIRNRVVATPVQVNGADHQETFELPATVRTVQLPLAESAWQIEQQPQGSTELMYMTERPLPAKVFGVIQVFNTGEWIFNQFRQYQALFARVG